MTDQMLTTEQIAAIKARLTAIRKHDVHSEELDEFYDSAAGDIDALLTAYEWLRNEFVSACAELEHEQADNEVQRAKVAALESELATAQAELRIAEQDERALRMLLSVNTAAGQGED